MEFRNHTPFPALAFAGIDQLDQEFHVVVLRQTLTWNDQGQLRYLDEQPPLCEEDSYFDDDLAASVRQESDLCHYKPLCDVIVNAHAHAPGGVPKERFQVGLKVTRPDEELEPPAPPQGLNPLQDPTEAQREAWQAEVQRRRSTPSPGDTLIDKQLWVTGPRWFVRRSAPLRWLGGLFKLVTFGLARRNGWRLTTPEPVIQLPLRNELAFGGECRIDRVEEAAKRVPKRHRLTPEQQLAHPDADAPPEKRPLAHQAFPPNPIGRGWSRDWFLKARHIKRLPAPQIEHPAHAITARHLRLARHDKLSEKEGADLLAGLGIRPKTHPERAKLVGTIDQAFIESEAWLPDDFDFAIWNAAWPDQQTDYLIGDELIELTNLCATDTPGAQRDEQGNTLLKLQLPGDLPFVLVRYEEGQIGELSAQLDTLIIEPDQRRLSCVWRATLDVEPEVRVLEARLLLKPQVDAFIAQAERHPPPETANG
jgi:hypothetical protein